MNDNSSKGGTGGSSGEILIEGEAVVTAIGGQYSGAGIGGGLGYLCSTHNVFEPGNGGNSDVITIRGMAVVKAVGGLEGGAGIGGGFGESGNGGDGGIITISDSADVTAIGGDYDDNRYETDGGAGIGGGGSNYISGLAANITIADTAAVKAYSYSSLPAIHSDGSNANGAYRVNARFNQESVGMLNGQQATLKIYPDASRGAQINNSPLTLPADYSCFAYTTGASDAYTYAEAYMGAERKWHVVRVSDDKPHLKPVSDSTVLPVKLEAGEVDGIVEEDYLINVSVPIKMIWAAFQTVAEPLGTLDIAGMPGSIARFFIEGRYNGNLTQTKTPIYWMSFAFSAVTGDS